MRTDEQLITALESVQAAPGGFGVEHASLCHDASRRLRELLRIEEEKEQALTASRELLREVTFCHLVLRRFPKSDVEREIAVVIAEGGNAKYAPNLKGRP